MKCFRRCFALLLCLVLLSGVFSVGVSAEEIDINPYHLYFSGSIFNDSGESFLLGGVSVYPSNGTYETNTTTCNFVYGGNVNIIEHIAIATDDGSVLFPKSSKATLKIRNIFWSFLVSNFGSGEMYYIKSPTSVYFLVTYSDGSAEYMTQNDFTIFWDTNSSFTDITLSDVSFSEDVVKLEVFTNHTSSISTLGKGMEIIAYLGEYDPLYEIEIIYDSQSEEAGLLSGILGWVQNIWNSITELPGKIWTYIENGLKDLFVPDEQFIIDYKDDMSDMMAEKLGAVWQVIDISFESWDRISASDETDTINFPVCTIDLPEDNTFSFGGWDVKIVPEGFQTFVSMVKLAVGIVCTVLFVNGLRKRYDEVMGVEQ